MPDSEAKILVVDDDPQVRRTLRRMLHHVGFPNVDENDGKTVLDTLKRHRYDLVICDLQMAPHSGLEVLEFVRADDDLKALPFIMLTGDATEAAVAAAVAMGASDYIAKPFSPQTLATKVERLLVRD